MCLGSSWWLLVLSAKKDLPKVQGQAVWQALRKPVLFGSSAGTFPSGRHSYDRNHCDPWKEKRPLNRLLIENSAVTVGLHSFRAELQEDPRSNTGWSKLEKNSFIYFFLKGTTIDVRVFLYHLGFSIFDIIMYYVISPFPFLLQNFPRLPPSHSACSFSNSRPPFSFLVVSLLGK